MMSPLLFPRCPKELQGELLCADSPKNPAPRETEGIFFSTPLPGETPSPWPGEKDTPSSQP